MPTPAALFLVLLLLVANPLGILWGNEGRYPPGILVDTDPVQTPLKEARHWEHEGYTITALANYEIEARLVRKHKYWFDQARDLSPVDFTVAWGQNSDQRILDDLKVSLSGRYFSWRPRNVAPPISPREIQSHFANMHLVPADDAVAKRLDTFDENDLIVLHGFLIKAERPDGFKWVSSLTRDDSGEGSCELMWVESAERRLKPPL